MTRNFFSCGVYFAFFLRMKSVKKRHQESSQEEEDGVIIRVTEGIVTRKWLEKGEEKTRIRW